MPTNLPAGGANFGGPTPIDRYRAPFDLPVILHIPNGIATSAMTAEIPLLRVRTTKRVPILAGAVLNPASAITKDTTNYITLEVGYRRGSGSFVSLASLTTNAASGTLAALTDALFTVSAGGALAKNDLVTLRVSKAASGQTLPACAVEVYFK